MLVMGVLYHIPWLTSRREKGVDLSFIYLPLLKIINSARRTWIMHSVKLRLTGQAKE